MGLINIKKTNLNVLKYDNDYHLLLDGDMFIYRAAWATNETSFAQARMSLLFSLYRIFDSLSSDNYTFYLTGRTNHRKDIYPLYKANRAAGNRPVHLNKLYKFAETTLNFHRKERFEEDDLIVIWHNPDKTIIVSNDKDFDQVVGFHYPSGGKGKCQLRWVNQEEADLFSAKQLLTGDRVDNIPGLSEKYPKRGIGDKRSTAMLTPWKGRDEAYKVILEAYTHKYGDDAEYMMMVNSYLLSLGIHGKELTDWRDELEEY